MERRRVVITGLGAVTPIGLTAGESWQAVKNGVCGIGPITHYVPAAQKVKLAAEVKGFDPEALLGRQESKRMGRFTQFAVAAAREALSDAGFSVEQADPDRCGVILSSGIGGQAITEAEHSRGLEKGFDRVSPFYVPTAICNMAAGQVAIDAGFRAMCSCPVTACAGGTNAVGDAFHYIRDGYAEVMLCGGTEASITPMSIGGFTSMKALTQTEDPNRASIPFDAGRSGFVMGEGAGVLLLEELEHAKTRGAKIYAEVVGYGATCDAHHITAPLADGSGGAKAMAMALTDGGVAPEQVGYINAHGTSTHLNDAGETAAVKTVFGPHAGPAHCDPVRSAAGDGQADGAGRRNKLGAGGNSEDPAGAETTHRPDAGAAVSGGDAEIADRDEQTAGTGWESERKVFLQVDRLAPGLQPAGGPQVDHAGADPWHGGTGGLVWRGGDPRPVPLIPAVAGLAAVETLLDEDEDAEEKRRRIEAKIAAENFGAVIGFAAGAALAVKEKLDEQAAQEEQKKQQQQTMGGL